MAEVENDVRQRVYQAHLQELLGRQESAKGYLYTTTKRLIEAQEIHSDAKARVEQVELEIRALRALAEKDGITLWEVANG